MGPLTMRLLGKSERGRSLPRDLSSELKQFIFEHIDSIGFLEALLLLESKPQKSWTTEALSQELRNNPASVAKYLSRLVKLKLVRNTAADQDEFVYDGTSSGLGPIISELREGYKVQPHRIIELVYSSLKKARQFSDAFLLPNASDKKEDDNG